MRTLHVTGFDVVGLLFGTVTGVWAAAMVLRVQPAIVRFHADMQVHPHGFLGLCLSPVTPIAVALLVLSPVCHGVAADVGRAQRAARMAFGAVVGIGLPGIVTGVTMLSLLTDNIAIR